MSPNMFGIQLQKGHVTEYPAQDKGIADAAVMIRVDL